MKETTLILREKLKKGSVTDTAWLLAKRFQRLLKYETTCKCSLQHLYNKHLSLGGDTSLERPSTDYYWIDPFSILEYNCGIVLLPTLETPT